MFPPNFGMKYVKVGSGDVVGKDNIEEFLTFVSKLYTNDKRSIVELTNSYDSAISCLVARLEKRFVNLNPILQQMFLNLDSMERVKEKYFLLETLLHEFDDIVKEARKIFTRYGTLGSYPNIHYYLDVRDENIRKYTRNMEVKEKVEISIPFKLLGMADALEDNFGWIAPQKLFDESSQPKRKEKGDYQPYIGDIQCIYDKFAIICLKDANALDFEKT